MSPEAKEQENEDIQDTQDIQVIQDTQDTQDAQEEQILYARVLEVGMYLGLLILFLTFALYVSGILAPAVPLDRISHYWNQGVHAYLEAVNRDYWHMEHPPTGWVWVTMLGKSDFLNFIGIAILSGITIICYLAIVPALLRKKDGAYLAMAVLEAVVLAMAASGILAVGH